MYQGDDFFREVDFGLNMVIPYYFKAALGPFREGFPTRWTFSSRPVQRVTRHPGFVCGIDPLLANVYGDVYPAPEWAS